MFTKYKASIKHIKQTNTIPVIYFQLEKTTLFFRKNIIHKNINKVYFDIYTKGEKKEATGCVYLEKKWYKYISKERKKITKALNISLEDDTIATYNYKSNSK